MHLPNPAALAILAFILASPFQQADAAAPSDTHPSQELARAQEMREQERARFLQSLWRISRQSGHASAWRHPQPGTTTATTTRGGMLSFNIDDGRLSAYENGLPIFNRAGIRVSYFPITAYLGRADYITADALQRIAASGHEIGNHTRSHPHLAQIPPDEARAEIEAARSDLEALGVKTTTFAYPYGDSNAAVQGIVRDTGYLGARGTYDGYIDHATNPYNLPRFDMNASTTIEQAKGIIDTAIAQKKWAILVFHHVGANNGALQDVAPEFVREVVSYAKKSGIEIVTNEEGLSRMPEIE